MLLAIVMLLSVGAAAWACLSVGFAGFDWIWVTVLSFLGAFLTQLILIFLVLWICAARVRMDVPQEKDSRFYRSLIYQAICLIIGVVGLKVRTQGLKKTPKEGRFLLVCNHIFDIDPGILLAYFHKSQLAFVSKKENDKKFLVGPLMHKILCQPIDRENDRQALKTILNCIRILKEDKASIAVFPEGYAHTDGLLRKFRPGVFKIAQKAQVPIVVCTITDTQYVLPNAMRLKPSKVDLHLVDVIPAEALVGKTTVQIAEEVYEMMAKDLGPDRVYQEPAENT